MPRGRPRKTQNATTEVPEKAQPASNPSIDPVRVEMMKRIYVARDPESTADTWLHSPECRDEGGKDAAARCEALGCGAFSGLEVVVRIDQGWWNSLPGDR